MTRLKTVILPIVLLFLYGCGAISQHAIDEEPKLSIDLNYLGIWKALEDTSSENYFLIQSYRDVFPKVAMYDEIKIDEHYLTNKTKYIFITYMNNGGRNPIYQQFHAFFSKVNNSTFLNISYNGTGEPSSPKEGYFFARIASENFQLSTKTLILEIVTDARVSGAFSSDQLKSYFENNIEKTELFGRTLHLYKVSNYHTSIAGSKVAANRK